MAAQGSSWQLNALPTRRPTSSQQRLQERQRVASALLVQHHCVPAPASRVSLQSGRFPCITNGFATPRLAPAGKDGKAIPLRGTQKNLKRRETIDRETARRTTVRTYVAELLLSVKALPFW